MCVSEVGMAFFPESSMIEHDITGGLGKSRKKGEGGGGKQRIACAFLAEPKGGRVGNSGRLEVRLVESVDPWISLYFTLT